MESSSHRQVSQLREERSGRKYGKRVRKERQSAFNISLARSFCRHSQFAALLISLQTDVWIAEMTDPMSFALRASLDRSCRQISAPYHGCRLRC